MKKVLSEEFKEKESEIIKESMSVTLFLQDICLAVLERIGNNESVEKEKLADLIFNKAKELDLQEVKEAITANTKSDLVSKLTNIVKASLESKNAT